VTLDERGASGIPAASTTVLWNGHPCTTCGTPALLRCHPRVAVRTGLDSGVGGDRDDDRPDQDGLRAAMMVL
jgi:hypothetical protein